MSILKRNILSNLIGQISLVVIGFVSFKYVYTSLGEDGLGIIYFSLMLSSILAASLELGLTKTTIRELASYEEVEPDYITELLQTFSFIYVCAYLLLSLAFVYSVPLITGTWVKLSSMDHELAIASLTLIGASSLLSIPKAFLSSICIGLQRMHINNSINVVIAILQQSGIVVLLLYSDSIINVAYWIMFTNILGAVVYVYITSQLVGISRLIPKFSYSVIRRVKKYLTNMAWISILAVFSKQMDKLLLSLLLPIGVLGIYSFVYTMVTKLTLIADSFMRAIFPVFSKMDSGSDKKELQDKFFSLEELLIYGLVPVFAAMVFAALPLFSALLDDAKAEMLLFPIFYLSLAFYGNGSLRIYNIYVSAIGRPTYIIHGILLMLLVSVPATVYLVDAYGMTGAAFSWIINTLVGTAYIIPAVHKNELHKSVTLWIYPTISAYVAAFVIYYPAWLMAKSYSYDSYFIYALFFMVATLIYLLIAMNLSSGGFAKTMIRYIPALKSIILTR